MDKRATKRVACWWAARWIKDEMRGGTHTLIGDFDYDDNEQDLARFEESLEELVVELERRAGVDDLVTKLEARAGAEAENG